MERARERTVIGGGGGVLLVSLFLPWAGDRSGWEVLAGADVLLVLAAVVALAAALTGGRRGLFRPDLSLNAAADLLGVASSLLVAALVLVELDDVAAGALLGLAGAIAIMSGAGDYATFRGAPLFPSTGAGRTRAGS